MIMFSGTNIEKQLLKYRNKRLGEEAIMDEVERIFLENEKHRTEIIATLNEKTEEEANNFDFAFLKTENIFT